MVNRMHFFNIHEAKKHFSELVEAAQLGKETVIAKAGKPVAKIVPLYKKTIRRRFGLLKGKIKIAKDFDIPLSDDLLSEFENITSS